MRAALTLALLLAAGGAVACGTVRIGYTNKPAPPYYMGSGVAPAEPPGAAVELAMRIVESAGCKVQLMRMPLPRLRIALADGQVDMAPMSSQAYDPQYMVLPQDASGGPDIRKAVDSVTVVFVRRADGVPAEADPLRYFKGRKLGLMLGAAYVEHLRASGILVDDGASTVGNNFEKLKLGRVDGYAVTLLAPTDFDGVIQARYGQALVRLNKPLYTGHTWLAASKPFYAANPELVERMWEWVRVHARPQFTELLRKYEDVR